MISNRLPLSLNPTKHLIELKAQCEVFGPLVGHAYTGEFQRQFFPWGGCSLQTSSENPLHMPTDNPIACSLPSAPQCTCQTWPYRAVTLCYTLLIPIQLHYAHLYSRPWQPTELKGSHLLPVRLSTRLLVARKSQELDDSWFGNYKIDIFKKITFSSISETAQNVIFKKSLQKCIHHPDEIT